MSIGPLYSYINVRDYETPKYLAGFLHELPKDQQKYYGYFLWKQTYDLRVNINRTCKLSEVAHNIVKTATPAHQDYNT